MTATDAGSIPVLAEPEAAEEDRCGLIDRIGIVLGGAAIGAAIGFVGTMTTGALEPRTAAIYTAPIYVVALYLGYGGWRDAADLGRWRAILPALLLVVIAAWPVALFVIADDRPPLWACAVVSLLAACVLTESSRSHSVFRSSWLMLLTSILATHDSLQTLMGP